MYKFQKALKDVPLIISFDLASRVSGVAWYETDTERIVNTYEINIKTTGTQRFVDLWKAVNQTLDEALQKYATVMVIKEALPTQNGKFTTINTLQSLAASHAILDLAVASREGAVAYDDHGVHSLSVRGVCRSEGHLKPSKEDVHKMMVDYYHLDDSKMTDNITDAIGVIYALIQKKWNQDIDAEVKEIKKEIKQLKLAKAIEFRQQEIQRLLNLKI